MVPLQPGFIAKFILDSRDSYLRGDEEKESELSEPHACDLFFVVLAKKKGRHPAGILVRL